MDNKKDINVSLSKTGQSPKIFVFGLFEKDNIILFLYKKVEKIVSALYLISNFLSDNEPIKWQFRKIGLSTISGILSLTNDSLSKPEVISVVSSDILKIKSLLEVAFTAGFISEMNFIILKNELENLFETLNSKISSEHNGEVRSETFSKDFFAVSRDVFIPRDSESFYQGSSFGELGQTDIEKSDLNTWSDVLHAVNSYKGHYKGHLNKKDKIISGAGMSKGGHVTDNKGHIKNDNDGNGRETAIINMLKTNNNLTIKDFSLVIKGCSEKTIQRELIRLVGSGILKKMGERRWSRYSLATI